MCSAIGVDYRVLIFTKRSNSIVKYCIDEVCIRRYAYRPGNRKAIKAVNDRGKIYLPGRYMKLCDIRQPLRVWLFRVEVSLNHIGNSRSYLSLVRVVFPPPDIRNDKLIFLHDASDYFF